MPSATFANLPAAKRQALIDIAIEEFAAHPYAVASVSQIVKRAGIAKGSIYQYFANKQELFLFLLDYTAQQQLALLQELTPPAPDLGFFALLRWQMSASLQVGMAAPQLARLMARAFSDDLPFRDEVVRRVQSIGETYLHQLIQRGVESGELDPAIDPELAAFVISRLTSDLGAFIARRMGVADLLAADTVEHLAGPVAEQVYDGIIRILQDGLSMRRRGPSEEEHR